MAESHIQEMSIYEDIDASAPDAIYRIVDMAKRLQRKTQELEERLVQVEEFVNE